MSEETKTNGQGNKRKQIVLIAAVAVIILAVAVGMGIYNSPGNRSARLLDLGQKYLLEQDYEQAIVNFELALEIDPNNQKVLETIKSHMEEFYRQARTYAGMGEYAAERELAVFMLKVDSENALAKIAEAEADCGNGDVDKSKDEFEKIIGTNSGSDEAVIVIGDNLDKFYKQARKYGNEGEYALEKELAEFMIKASPDNVRGKIAGAEADSGLGDVGKARDEYQEAVGGGVDEEDVAKGIKYCDALLRLLEYCEESNWNEAASYMNTGDFSVVSERLVDGKSAVYSSNTDILVGKSGGGVYVYSGGLSDGIMDGNGIGIVSAVNTCSIYDGEWKDHFPSGRGVLTMWNKNEDISMAALYEGDFSNGLLNGAALLKTRADDAPIEVNLEINNGQVNVYKVDDDGNIWISDAVSESGCSYVVEYETAENGVIANYAAGLPGFGGSDRILGNKLLDIVPPVIKCNLKTWTTVGTYVEDECYEGKNPIGKGITASDNVDGDLTAKITNTSKRTANWNGYDNEWAYGLVVVYSVADSAGNTAELTVAYNVEELCERWEYYVLSVK